MDPATLLQRLIRAGALTTAQARWVEQQADAGARTVEELLLQYGLVGAEDLAAAETGGPIRAAADRAGTSDLVAVAAAQRRCDRMMQVIFELCVARGVIDHQEYLERLAEAERDPSALPGPR